MDSTLQEGPFCHQLRTGVGLALHQICPMLWQWYTGLKSAMWVGCLIEDFTCLAGGDQIHLDSGQFVPTMTLLIVGGNDKTRQFLILPIGSYKWSSFTVGDTVPPDAVMGGYWLDLSPLYIVKKTFIAATCSGYFSTAMAKAFIACSGKHNPSAV